MPAPSRSPQGRLRLAVPSKGRLHQPATALLREAGLDFEVDGRRLFAPCSNLDLDLLFVRAEDVGEYVQDGVVDLGITGTNLLREAAAKVQPDTRLGFGACSLQLAVPILGGIESAQQMAGKVVATSHPRTTEEFFANLPVSVRLIEIQGAVEIAPLLGVADAIVDLVATGTTLATNGLRPIASLLDSEAELVRAPDLGGDREAIAATVSLMLNSVISARDKKYLMLNAPHWAIPQIRELIPGMGSPSILPLAEPGMVAVHVAVDAGAIWDLLGPLRSAGASSILVLPIERLIQ